MIQDVKRITTEADVIRITGDFDGGERLIHINMDDHGNAAPSAHGHSIGHWEGRALVIHTSHFLPHIAGNGHGVPSGPGKQLVERLVPNEDGTVLTWYFELSDPDYLSAPISDGLELVFRPDMEFATEPCDLESARRYLEY